MDREALEDANGWYDQWLGGADYDSALFGPQAPPANGNNEEDWMGLVNWEGTEGNSAKTQPHREEMSPEVKQEQNHHPVESTHNDPQVNRPSIDELQKLLDESPPNIQPMLAQIQDLFQIVHAKDAELKTSQEQNNHAERQISDLNAQVSNLEELMLKMREMIPNPGNWSLSASLQLAQSTNDQNRRPRYLNQQMGLQGAHAGKNAPNIAPPSDPNVHLNPASAQRKSKSVQLSAAKRSRSHQIIEPGLTATQSHWAGYPATAPYGFPGHFATTTLGPRGSPIYAPGPNFNPFQPRGQQQPSYYGSNMFQGQPGFQPQYQVPHGDQRCPYPAPGQTQHPPAYRPSPKRTARVRHAIPVPAPEEYPECYGLAPPLSLGPSIPNGVPRPQPYEDYIAERHDRSDSQMSQPSNKTGGAKGGQRKGTNKKKKINVNTDKSQPQPRVDSNNMAINNNTFNLVQPQQNENSLLLARSERRTHTPGWSSSNSSSTTATDRSNKRPKISNGEHDGDDSEVEIIDTPTSNEVHNNNGPCSQFPAQLRL